MRFSRIAFSVLCVCFVVSACKESPEVKQEVIEIRQESKHVPRTREEKILSFAPVIKKVAPAVVNIYAFQHANPLKVDSSLSPFMEDPFFKQFFEQLHPGEGREQDSLGSGVIVSQDGLILTNDHVIENADEIRVVLSDKREYAAKLVVTDKKTDLALLQIQGETDFPYLTVSSVEDLEVGDVVMAIGNPFGVGQTVTNGIVSALARSQEGISDYRSFIQTDAAINPGNSGGALVTTDGRLVGINTAIYSKSGGSMGIGFAIPTILAIPVIESVKNGGRIIRPWAGLEVAPVTIESAHALGLPRPYGVLVKGVYPDGPADKAGVKVGDFIAALNDHEISDDSAFVYQVAVSPLGKKSELTIFRKGVEKKIPIILKEPMSAKDDGSFIIKGKNPLYGAHIRTLSPALATDLGINPMKQGVVITEISDTVPARKLGIQPGDILESINKKNVKTTKDVAHLLDSARHEWILIFRRGHRVLTFQVQG
ncbi:MAG TPA: Do family serine endopeptidase [Alphaproteobacteria bacterium]|nr:Do family serine endopeptidase [Alphaproteobacteria bacterium]